MVERIRYGIMHKDGRVLAGTSRSYYFEPVTTKRRLATYETPNQAIGYLAMSYGPSPEKFEESGYKIIKIREIIEEIEND